MKKYVILFDFQIENSNISFSGRFCDYAYSIQGSKLSVIYSKKKNHNENIGDHFQLDAAFFGLISLISLAFEIRCSTSRNGYVFENTLDFNKYLKKQKGYDELLQKLRGLKRLSNLQADHKPLGFKQGSPITFSQNHLQLAESIVTDVTEKISHSTTRQRYFTQLDYWRRAYDLSELRYEAEGFLNYFKIVELILKDSGQRKLTDDYIKQELKKFKLASLAKRVIFYRNLRNKFNIGHYIPLAPQQNDYDEYISNMSDWIWNHESDMAQVAKLLILRDIGCRQYFLKEDGGLYFVDKRN